MSKKRKTKTKELIKPLSKQEVKERISRCNYYETHPDSIYANLWKILAKPIEKWSEEESKYLWTNAKSIDNFDKSHIWLAETQFDGLLRTTVVELTNNLIKEYNCNTTLEKSLCEIVANSYGKILQLSQKVTVNINTEYISKERTDWLNSLSKELDRSNRNYLFALNNLIELKRPKVNVNVKTKNTYFWQNQQFNSNIKENENIKG